MHAQPLDLRGDCPQPRRGFFVLRLQAAHGGALAAMPLFESRQFRAQRRMIFTQRRRFDFQLLQELPLIFQLLFALLAQFFFFRDRLLTCVRAAPADRSGVALQAIQFQPRDG